MAQWGFEGAYLLREHGEQICLTAAETEPISWKHQGGRSLLFAPAPWALWGGWDHGKGPCLPPRHIVATCSPQIAALKFPNSHMMLQSTVHDGVGGGGPETKLGLNHSPGLNRAKLGLL